MIVVLGDELWLKSSPFHIPPRKCVPPLCMRSFLGQHMRHPPQPEDDLARAMYCSVCGGKNGSMWCFYLASSIFSCFTICPYWAISSLSRITRPTWGSSVVPGSVGQI